MHPVARTSLKIAGVATSLIVFAVLAGIGYTWYMSEYGESPQAVQAPVKPTGGIQDSSRPKISDTATIGAVVQSITSPVVPGSNASIMVRTNPEATCTVSVIYDKTASKDSGLVQKKADEYGLVEWTWTVEGSAPLGTWPIEVSCANKKNSAVVQNDLHIVKSLE